MSDPLNPETYLGPIKDGDVVIDAAHYMGVLESTVGLMRYQRYARMVGSPVVVADASTCRVFVDRRCAVRAVRDLLGRNAEVTRERDEARQRCREAAQILIAAIGATAPEDVTTTAKRAVERIEQAEARVSELEAEVERLREALTPSGATKAAYIGEVTDRDGMTVSWTAIKDVLALVRRRAALAPQAPKEVQP